MFHLRAWRAPTLHVALDALVVKNHNQRGHSSATCTLAMPLNNLSCMRGPSSASLHTFLANVNAPEIVQSGPKGEVLIVPTASIERAVCVPTLERWDKQGCTTCNDFCLQWLLLFDAF